MDECFASGSLSRDRPPGIAARAGLSPRTVLIVGRHGPRLHQQIISLVAGRGHDLRGAVYQVEDAGCAVCLLEVAGRPERMERLPAQLRRIPAVLDADWTSQPPPELEVPDFRVSSRGGGEETRTEAVLAVAGSGRRRLGAADGNSVDALAGAFARLSGIPAEVRTMVLVQVVHDGASSSHVRLQGQLGKTDLVLGCRGLDPVGTTVAALARLHEAGVRRPARLPSRQGGGTGVIP